MASPPMPNERQVLDAAEHVRYESDMLGRTVVAMLSLPEATSHRDVISWALIESHLLHRRSLIDFLTREGRGPKGRDIPISDYRIPGWPMPKGDSRDELLAHKRDEIDSRLAHLTYRRTDLDLRGWDFTMSLKVLDELKAWANACDEQLPWHSELGKLLQGIELSLAYVTEAQSRIETASRPAQDSRS